MAEVFDIILDNEMDLIIEDGDFVVEESTLQHQNILLLSHKGQFKQSPTIGVGIDIFLNDEVTSDEIRRRIQEQFELDGMTIQKLKINGRTNLTIIAPYGTQRSNSIR